MKHLLRILPPPTISRAMLSIALIGMLIITLTGCVKYDAEPFTGYTLPRITGYNTGVTNDWLYINLRTGQMMNRDKVNEDITEGEQRDRLDWDIAFCGYRMRTNSGTSGSGKGGAADLGQGRYDHWISKAQLPSDLEWVVDDHTVSVTMSRNDWNKYLLENKLDFDLYPWFDPNSGPASTLTDANPLLSQAITFLAPPPVYTPTFHTFVVRTADGQHYYKLQIISWYKPDTEIGDTGGQISYYCDELK